MSILRADDKKYEFSVDIETWSDNMGQIKKNLLHDMFNIRTNTWFH